MQEVGEGGPRSLFKRAKKKSLAQVKEPSATSSDCRRFAFLGVNSGTTGSVTKLSDLA